MCLGYLPTNQVNMLPNILEFSGRYVVCQSYVEDADLLRGCYPYQWTFGRGLYFFIEVR